MVVGVCLLYGTAHPALGADDDLEYVVGRLREAWPGVRIHVRGDSGFGVPAMYAACERLDVDYTFGFSMNARVKRLSENTLEMAVGRFEATGEPQRQFCAFWYKADSWPVQRRVVLKCEANAQGTNRRAVVTNRPGAFVLPEAAYDAYTDRGESENRNKELKDGLAADRLSDHRYFANLFRLYLHTVAYLLLVRMRHVVADPPSTPTEDVPAEALAGHRRRAWHNQRREHDPLGEGHPCTWRHPTDQGGRHRARIDPPRRGATLLQLALPRSLPTGGRATSCRRPSRVGHQLVLRRAKSSFHASATPSIAWGKGGFMPSPLHHHPQPASAALPIRLQTLPERFS